jgi:hypothetical protein
MSLRRRGLADIAEEQLRAALTRTEAADVKKQLERILDTVYAPVPERLRQVRAAEVLEGIGTPEAWRLLKKLATGAPGARLTREAKASLQRLGRGP